MKKLIKNSIIALLVIAMIPAFAATPVEPSKSFSTEITQSDVQKMEQRLEEIKAMDISNMSRAEKRALRKEVKQIERTMDGGGIYISVGALIIIIILLIILL